jgi:hydrogenase maturation protein HypF
MAAEEQNSSQAVPVRRAVQVRGVVQGVGFRPFVYRLAQEEELAGCIGNDTDGVTIEIEGPGLRVERFLARLRAEMPPLARIDAVAVHATPPLGETAFRIVHSAVLGPVSTGIPADAATCADCLRELLDPADRRYRYPFLNCTNCGPRYTITKRIPYDRPQTSMAIFPMCPACQAEYDDPRNRRFHAQPNACSVCGPKTWLESNADLQTCSFRKAEVDSLFLNDPIAQTIHLLLAGQILAIKGIGGFHLSVDATNEAAVLRLRQRKRRYGKPLAVMVKDLDAARTICSLSAEEEALLCGPARPIVLARRRPGVAIAEPVAPGIPWLGVFLPYAPLQHLLFADGRLRALVMTSANLSEEPIAIDNEEAQARLSGIADAFLLHDREILQRCDDSVAAVVDGAPQLLRRARGYVPLGVELPMDAPPLLAVGGHLKNVFALAQGRFAYQSQHLGDLETLTGLEFFRASLDHLMRTFEIEPRAVVHDLHPGYLSTQWANQWAADRQLPLLGVQHHHAHLAGCMAENGVQGAAIGLALDGTGYGLDGTIWGGEVLLVDNRRGTMERFAHLQPFALPGGDQAIREPWRAALQAEDALRAAGMDVAEALGATPAELRVLERMIERRLNAPLTSSLGRLFDAVAALLLGRRRVDYEAQAAIELEGIAVDEPDDWNCVEYALELIGPEGSAQTRRENADPATALRFAQKDNPIMPHSAPDDGAPGDAGNPAKPLELRTDRMWQALVGDLRRGQEKPCIAARFHVGVAQGFIQAVVRAGQERGIAQVALSGGCLHNRRLARLLRKGLEAQGFTVYAHRRVSPGDGGLSYGQAVVAAALLAAGATE